MIIGTYQKFILYLILRRIFIYRIRNLIKPKLYSVGVGFNFFLPIGLMSFQLANGNQFGNEFRFGDTKIHWGLLSRF